MITITNKLVLSMLLSPVPTITVNNIAETIVNNVIRSTTLFSHDNRVVTALFNQQCAIFSCVVQSSDGSVFNERFDFFCIIRVFIVYYNVIKSVFFDVPRFIYRL